MNESIILEWYEWIVVKYYNSGNITIRFVNRNSLTYSNETSYAVSPICDKTMYLIDIFSSLSRAHRYNFYPYITGMSKSEYGCT